MIHRTGIRDKNRYCKFHEDCGHDMWECYDLKKEIERLIESGSLRKFTSYKEEKEHRKEGADKGKKKEEERGRKKEVAGVINVIKGGKNMKAGKKRPMPEIIQVTEQARGESNIVETITFFAEDGAHVKRPYNDALAYKGIGGELGKLKHCLIPIVGLGGTPVQPKYLAELITEFRRGGKDIKEIKTLFSIVDMPLAYNGILGRPFLYDSGAFTSIRYLVTKIPTTAGTINIKGDQEVASRCYTIAMKEAGE
ncbi:uncharacterized protein LOC126668518 [Mercurialis annua]|uniref:uncharacterized protein LOC126668518 n=1 Tax=Mercurialis annua TaxID=3986 RepID=UPI00215F76B0|nr:uncharacterized protein LOC126668518 [Mercurialis annua]